MEVSLPSPAPSFGILAWLSRVNGDGSAKTGTGRRCVSFFVPEELLVGGFSPKNGDLAAAFRLFLTTDVF